LEEREGVITPAVYSGPILYPDHRGPADKFEMRGNLQDKVHDKVCRKCLGIFKLDHDYDMVE
jgi:hypothetical protein